MALSVVPTIPTPVSFDEFPNRHTVRPPDVTIVGATSFDFTNTLTMENITCGPSDNIVVVTSSRKGSGAAATNPATGASFGSADLIQLAPGASESANAISTSIWLLKGSDLTSAQQNTPTDLVVVWPTTNWGCLCTAFRVNSDRVSEHDISGMTAVLVEGTNAVVNEPTHSYTYTPTFAHSTVLFSVTINDNAGVKNVGATSHDVISLFGDGMCTTPGPVLNNFVMQMNMIQKQSGMTDMTFSYETGGYPDFSVSQWSKMLAWAIEIPGKPIREYSINGERLGKRLLDENCSMVIHGDSLWSSGGDTRLFVPFVEKSPIKVKGVGFNALSGQSSGSNFHNGSIFDSIVAGNIAAVNEIQTIGYSAVTSVGTYNINYNSNVSTGTPINTDSATSGAVQSHLELLPGFGAGDFSVSGTTLADFTITFQGTGAGLNMLPLGIQNWSGGGLGPNISTTVQGKTAHSGQLFDILSSSGGTSSIFGTSISSGPTGSLLPTLYNETLFKGPVTSNAQLSIPGYIQNKNSSSKSFHGHIYGEDSQRFNSHLVDWQSSDFLFDSSMTGRLFYLQGPSGASFTYNIGDFGGPGIWNDVAFGKSRVINSFGATEMLRWADITTGGLNRSVFEDTSTWKRGGSRIRSSGDANEVNGTGVIVFGTKMYAPSASGIQVAALSYGGSSLTHHTQPEFTNPDILSQFYEGNEADTFIIWVHETTALETTINLYQEWIDLAKTAAATAKINDPSLQDPLIVLVASWPGGGSDIENLESTRVYESELARLAIENDCVFVNLYRMAKDRFGEYNTKWTNDTILGLLGDSVHPTYSGGSAFIKMFYQEVINQAYKKLAPYYTKPKSRLSFVSETGGGASEFIVPIPNIVGPITNEHRLTNVLYSINAASANARVNIEYSGATQGFGYTASPGRYPILTLSGSGQLDMRDSNYGMRFSMIPDFTGHLSVTPVNMGPNDSYNIVLEYE